MDRAKTETAVGDTASMSWVSGNRSLVVLRPEVIADTGAAVDLIGARDLHNKDKQGKTSEPIHSCTANGTTEADTIVQYYSSALGEEVSPHVD